jgi:hypothetical protein
MEGTRASGVNPEEGERSSSPTSDDDDEVTDSFESGLVLVGMSITKTVDRFRYVLERRWSPEPERPQPLPNMSCVWSDKKCGEAKVYDNLCVLWFSGDVECRASSVLKATVTTTSGETASASVRVERLALIANRWGLGPDPTCTFDKVIDGPTGPLGRARLFLDNIPPSRLAIYVHDGTITFPKSAVDRDACREGAGTKITLVAHPGASEGDEFAVMDVDTRESVRIRVVFSAEVRTALNASATGVKRGGTA